MRRAILPLLLAGSLALGGCAAGIAAGAVGAVVQAASPEREAVTEDRRQPAVAACTARAARHGEVRIIDAEQRESGRVTVWGTVQDERERRAFECRYDGEVSAFSLRTIRAR